MSEGMVDALIGEYVAGSLPEPARVLMASHIEMRPSSALVQQAFETIAGRELQGAPCLAMSDADRRLDAIFRSDAPPARRMRPQPRNGGLPSALRDYLGYDLSDIPWKRKLPGLRQYTIEHNKDGSEASLLWARPGRALPNHTHEGLELTLVLDGDFYDHRGRFAQGDVSVADESLDHRPVAGREKPCLCFSVLFAPIVLSGSKMGLLGDIFGL